MRAPGPGAHHAPLLSQRQSSWTFVTGSGRQREYAPGLAEIGPTFGPLVKAWRETAAGYSDSELRLLLESQGKVQDIVLGQLARLRGDLDQRGASRG